MRLLEAAEILEDTTFLTNCWFVLRNSLSRFVQGHVDIWPLIIGPLYGVSWIFRTGAPWNGLSSDDEC